LFSLSATGINNTRSTGGKFAAGVNDTVGKFATSDTLTGEYVREFSEKF
jgi:hypothetical protein